MPTTVPTIVIVSGSKPVALALERFLLLTMRFVHTVLTQEFCPQVPADCSVVFDVSSPFRAAVDASITIDPDFAFAAFRMVLVKLQKEAGVQKFHFGMVRVCSVLEHWQSGLLPHSRYDRNKRMTTMIINSLASIWHHLKHNRNDELLNALCALGHAREAESYIKTWDVDEKQAKAFAQRMEYAIGNSSQVYGGTPPKAEPSMPAAVSKKIFYALLVDDQEEMYDRLAQELWKVNQDNPEYELRLRYVPDVQRAESALDGPGLQAIILDYLLTESDFSGSTQPGTASVKLSKIIAERRPGLAVFGLTGFVPHRTTAGDTTAWNATNSDWQVQRVFFKHDPAEVHELLRAVVHSVRQRASTPFFSSLKQYSEWPTTVFHALPLSRSKSVAASQWAKEFAQFYGEHYRRPGLRRAQLALF